MTFYINTSEFDQLHIALADKEFFAELLQDLAFNENFKTIALIEQFFKSLKIQPSNLKKIIVCSGPGSFTGIRVGVSVAQAIGFALNIPVLTIPKNKIPKNLAELNKKSLVGTKQLNYGAKPNITKSKKKKR